MKRGIRGWSAVALALLLLALAAGLPILLRLFLIGRGASPDVSGNTAKALFVMLAAAAGFLVSLAAGGRALGPLLVAALGVFGIAFAALWRDPPMSFSYVYMLAPPSELALYAALAAAIALLVGWMGSTVAQLLGAGGRFDASMSFEYGIARTHVRLNKRTAIIIALLGIVPPALLVLAGTFARPEVLVLFVVIPAVILVVRLVRSRRAVRHKKRIPPTAVMTIISIGGVAVGVCALTVVLSVMSGFELDLKRKILGTNAHAVVMKYAGDFSEWPTTLKKVSAVPGVVGETPFILNEVMLASEQNLAGSVVSGIDPATVGTVTDLPRNIEVGKLDDLNHCENVGVEKEAAPRKPEQDIEKEEFLLETKDFSARRRKAGDSPPTVANLPCIVIGREMARSLKVWVGDAVNVITPLGGDLGPTGPVPRSKTFRVAAIFFSGMYEYDSKFAYITLTEAQKFFRMGSSVTGLELKVADIDAAKATARRVLAALEGFPYRTKDWSEMNRSLFSALKIEKLTMAIILTFIVLVASFNIVSTLILLVIEKRKEIAILKSMGTRDSSIMKIFVIEGLIIGGVGAAMGLLLGYGSCKFIERYGLRLDPEVYYLSSLPVRIDGAQLALVVLIAVVLSYLATLYPALKAARLPPVEGLSNE